MDEDQYDDQPENHSEGLAGDVLKGDEPEDLPKLEDEQTSSSLSDEPAGSSHTAEVTWKEVVAGGDNSGLHLADSTGGLNPPGSLDEASVKPGKSKRKVGSPDEAARDQTAKQAFAQLAELGCQFGQLGTDSISVRNRLICAAVKLVSSTTFDAAHFCKVAKIRRTSRTPTLLAIVRGALGKSNRKLASKWTTGALELVRTVSEPAAVMAALTENGLEFYVKAARKRGREAAASDAGADPTSTPASQLVLRGAPPALRGRVVVMLDLHDNVAEYVGTVTDRETGDNGGSAAGGATPTGRG